MRNIVPVPIREVLSAHPLDRGLEPCFIEPDLVMIDDLAAPLVLQTLVDGFGSRDVVADTTRVRCVSTVDRDDALPHRIQGDDLLLAFAEEYGIPFERLSGACANGCPLPVTTTRPSCVVATAPIEGAIGADGGLALRINATDAAVMLATNRVWYRRPAVQIIDFTGELPHDGTTYDLAISARACIEPARLVIVRGVAQSDSVCRVTLCALLEDSPAAGILCDPDLASPVEPLTTIRLEEIRAVIGEGAGTVCSVDELAGLTIDRAYIGSCTTGSVRDLREAAMVLAGSRVAIPTVISPSSMQDLELLESETLNPHVAESPSLVRVFQEAGCDIGMPGCSSCVNAIADLLEGDGEPELVTCLATAVGNVTTQKAARVLTASPTTVARAAVRGRIVGST